MNRKPKILFVTMHWPGAPTYGAQLRVLNIGRQLNRIGTVSLVIVSPHDADDETVRRTEEEFEVARVVRPMPASFGGALGRMKHRLRHEIDPNYLATDPVCVSQKDREALLELMHEHDVTWVHTVKIANWFRIARWPRSVLDVDDLTSRVYRSESQSGSRLQRRLLDARMSRIWRRRENLLTRRFDVVTVCSEYDREYLGASPKIHVLPNGFHVPAPRPRVLRQPPRLGYIGLFSYGPNSDGVDWFIRQAWPIIKRELPQVQLRLVGKESDKGWDKLGQDIAGLGWVEDASDEIATWSAMIVPIRSGGGTRIKVAEGFARKCPVVATRLGAFGYDVRDGEEILLADEPVEFAQACVRLLRDPAFGQTMAERAHLQFLNRWTWDALARPLEGVVQDCIRGGVDGLHPALTPTC